MSGYTPGPWEVGQHPAVTKGWIVRPVLFGTRVKSLPECEGGAVLIINEADARLIAAAPELLEALQKARNTMAGCRMANIAADICDTAITKATGA